MRFTYILTPALLAGGLALAATAPASAAETGAAKINLANADVMTVAKHGWRGGGHRGSRNSWRGGRHYGGRSGVRRGWGHRGYRGYRGPRLGIYVAPRRAYRRCWINARGYRVCRR